jgi:hypothetical protein
MAVLDTAIFIHEAMTGSNPVMMKKSGASPK